MKARIRGFRGVDRADLEIEPIALIAGRNATGKSSVCQAIGAALTGQPIPFFKPGKPDRPAFTKAAAAGLLRAGMDAGYCEIVEDGATLAVAKWPELSASCNGTAGISKVAAGVIHPLDFDDEARQRFFSSLLRTEPDEADVRQALADAGIENAEADGVLRTIAVQGMDGAWKHYREEGARLKGQWEAHAGCRYGERKAADWRPDGWRADLEQMSLEQIGTLCSAAKAKLEAAIGALAVSESEQQMLERQAAEERMAEESLASARASVQVARDAAEKAKAALQKLTPPGHETRVACPYCKGLLTIDIDAAGKYRLLPAEEKSEPSAASQQVYDMAKERVAETNKRLQAALAAESEALGRYRALRGAAERLAATKGKRGTQEEVDLAADYHEGLLRDKKRIETMLLCSKLHAEIAKNQRIVDLLAPEGLRRRKLAHALSVFHREHLAPLCEAAGYQPITLDDTLHAIYDGRPYWLLSQSEQYRVRAVLQIATARMEGAKTVIMDGADVLDQDGREGLFALLASMNGMRFIVAMTVDEKDQVPNLAEHGLGRTYWMERGVAAVVS